MRLTEVLLMLSRLAISLLLTPALWSSRTFPA